MRIRFLITAPIIFISAHVESAIAADICIEQPTWCGPNSTDLQKLMVIDMRKTAEANRQAAKNEKDWNRRVEEAKECSSNACSAK